MKMVTLRSFDNTFSAHILMNHLEAAGIACFLADENTMHTNPILGTVIGGIKVQVSQQDEAAAIAVLEQLDEIYRNNAVCPRCGQKGLDYLHKQGPRNILSAIATYLLGGFAMAPEKVYQCSRCFWESPTLPPIPADEEDTAFPNQP